MSLTPSPRREAPSVTVVIPAYRSAATIGRALDSVLAQSTPPRQVVVVDDGSPDDIAGAVARFGEAVQLVRKENGGASSARNRGIAESTADLIAFLDADDYWEADKLRRQVEVFRRHPEVGMVGANLYSETAHEGPFARRVDPTVDPRLCDRVLRLFDGHPSDAFDAAGQFWTGTTVVRADLLRSERFEEDLSTAEDRDMWFRLLRRTPAYLISEPLATCVLVPDSLSRGDIDRDCRNMLLLLARHRGSLGEKAYRRHVSDVYRRWSTRLLADGRPRDGIRPALARLLSHPSPHALWTVAKCAVLPTRRAARRNHVTVQALTTKDDLQAIEREWRDLHGRLPHASFTTRWDWMTTWWDVFGAGRELRLLAARDGGRLVGIAPFCRRTVRLCRVVPVRRLDALATGEEEHDEILSEYLDLLVEPGREDAVVSAFVSHLEADRNWDELLLPSVPASSPTPSALSRAASPTGLSFRSTQLNRAVVARLAATPAELIAMQGKRMREDLRRHRRLLEAHGRIGLRRVETPSDLEEAFDALVRFHQMLWQSRGERGCFASERFTEFHRRVTRRLLSEGLLDLYVVTVGERAVAARYCVHVGSTMFEYQSGFDPAFDPKISLGTQALWLCMEDAGRRGFTGYDLGEGDRPYKVRWTHDLVSTVNLRLLRPTTAARAQAAVEWITSRARQFGSARRPGAEPAKKAAP